MKAMAEGHSEPYCPSHKETIYGCMNGTAFRT